MSQVLLSAACASRRLMSPSAPVKSCRFANPNFRGFSSSDPPFPATKGRREPYRRLDVAIVGAPNAGKSQLLNVLTDTTVSAVSRKRHTTRAGTLGARTVGNTQVAFVDTPGFLRLEHAKKERLDRDLIVSAESAMENVDYTLVVVDAARTPTNSYLTAIQQLMQNSIRSEGRNENDGEVKLYEEGEEESLKYEIETIESKLNLQKEDREKLAIVLNKVDLVNPKSDLLVAAQALSNIAKNCILYELEPGLYPQADPKFLLDNALEKPLPRKLLNKVEARAPFVYYVSALEEDGTEELLIDLFERATPCQTWRLEREVVTDREDLERVEEIIREKLYRCLHREVPHEVRQKNRTFQKNDGEDESVVIIDQDLIVATKSHQRLVYGNNRKTLMRIQESAVRDLSRYVFPDSRIDLRLHVKLQKGPQA